MQYTRGACRSCFCPSRTLVAVRLRCGCPPRVAASASRDARIDRTGAAQLNERRTEAGGPPGRSGCCAPLMLVLCWSPSFWSGLSSGAAALLLFCALLSCPLQAVVLAFSSSSFTFVALNCTSGAPADGLLMAAARSADRRREQRECAAGRRERGCSERDRPAPVSPGTPNETTLHTRQKRYG
jgi:hypothetical protein